MYGQIHLCVRSLVLDKFGQDAWIKIVAEAGLDDKEHFMTFHQYTDDDTLKLVKAVSTVLGVEIPVVLEIFGEYFFTYCLEHGYDKMLLTLGDNMFTFIQNLDSLHALLAMSLKSIDAPSFRCEMENPTTMILHYYSSRQGLYPIVTGMLKSIGGQLFNSDIKTDVIGQATEVMLDGKEISHVTFRVHIHERKEQTDDSTKKKGPKTIGLSETICPIPFLEGHSFISPKQFCELFPFHIIFDSDLTIMQCGMNIQKMTPMTKHVGKKLNDAFELVKPQVPFTYDHILRFINATFILQLFDFKVVRREATATTKARNLTIKGQMINLGSDVNHLIFIGSPRLSSLSELQEKNLYLSDIPLYDVTRELVLLNQQRIAEIEISKKLDETTAELKRTAEALEDEKAKTDMLLYQMLPVKVANSLRDGNKVEAEKFSEVTILFSDIVTFTNISAAVQPMQVVDLLNQLYQRFDRLTEIHDVYKVETIGDAYMVVGGVPEASLVHAQKVANFALGMVLKAAEVQSPATGKPIQIRVGMHTGPVVAGVVGDKMPRYCLFGDTVNTASRMESHGLPALIHCSPTTYNAIADKGYKFETRGEIEVKGKGKMITYFLKEGPDISLIENTIDERQLDDQNDAALSTEGNLKKSTLSVRFESDNVSGVGQEMSGQNGVQNVSLRSMSPASSVVSIHISAAGRRAITNGKSNLCTLL